MREKIEDKKARVLEIINTFREVYGQGECTLRCENPLQLLISTILAAQCTDKRVNMVTEELYKKYPDVYAFAEADELELREDIRSTGFFRNKAKNIIGCCKMLIEDYGGEVPKSMDDLLRLPGVGRKTANLVRGDSFNIPGIVVDTHAKRLSNRLGLTENSDPAKIEFDLLEIVPQKYQIAFGHYLVNHGREYCPASRPRCADCPINRLCPKVGVKK